VVEDENLVGILQFPVPGKKVNIAQRRGGSAARASGRGNVYLRGNERVIDNLVRNDCMCSNAFCYRLMKHAFG
jgi:hypothetical protein